MPGVLKSNSHCLGYSEIGKMAFSLDPEFMNLTPDDDLEDITNTLFDSLPLSQTTQSSEGLDSDNELPDNEAAVDLIKYLDSDNTDIEFHTGLDGLGSPNDILTLNKYNRFRVSTRLDPFMGLGGQSSSSDSVGSRLDYDSDHLPLQQSLQQQRFSAWNTTPKVEEPSDILNKSGLASLFGITEDDQEDHIFPDTPSPSSRSGSGTGDDSDVDIETVTDNPRAADSCGYFTHDSSSSSPAGSPAPYKGKSSVMSAAARLSAETSLCKSSGFSSFGVSSSASLAENLMIGRTSHLGKRKMPKEKKSGYKSPTPSYTHILCNSNSVNFHDYAMSPGASTSSTETGRPTVMTKRIYKRKQTSVDSSDKEKQHHHNQLERNRRQKLADLFIDLRDEVPKIANQAKASKVVILNESTLYIRELQKHQRKQEHDISVEQQKKEMLEKQLRHLKAKYQIDI
ncbi:myc proto-oncogene protein [Biomphalaria pfeifferi]|uniref:Myc proto-oncogene protein n=1 Tax=Biomphalaria pfeifferi TaxID=112525 RepID=A0AAD8BJZ0_BIOPF|nr:myc proto-oncogene protein [Biomphalaria pfeifferi]